MGLPDISLAFLFMRSIKTRMLEEELLFDKKHASLIMSAGMIEVLKVDKKRRILFSLGER